MLYAPITTYKHPLPDLSSVLNMIEDRPLAEMDLMSSFKANLGSMDVLRLPLVIKKGLDDLRKTKFADFAESSKSDDMYEQKYDS